MNHVITKLERARWHFATSQPSVVMTHKPPELPKWQGWVRKAILIDAAISRLWEIAQQAWEKSGLGWTAFP